jgi:hypothetical protein
MAIQKRRVAIERARKKKTNVPGSCQKTVRDYFDAPSAGDQDRDKDFDANDGWQSEPLSARHLDRNPPAGYPGYFKNRDGNGFGHRTLSLPGGRQRSTDFNGKTKKWDKGKMGTGTIEEIEKAMGLVWVGWSTTISGHPIPSAKDDEPTPQSSTAVGERVNKAVKLLQEEVADKNGRNKRLVNNALKILQSISQK